MLRKPPLRGLVQKPIVFSFSYQTVFYRKSRAGLLKQRNYIVVSPLLSYTSEQNLGKFNNKKQKNIYIYLNSPLVEMTDKGNNTLSYHTQVLFTFSTDRVQTLEYSYSQVALPYKFI